MQPDKVTIVTGEPRSGTSLMMQTLNLLGVPVVGDINLGNNNRRGKDKVNNTKNLNPRGFFEIPGVVVRGFSEEDAADYHGKAIKIINTGLVKTPVTELDTVILCVRDPRNIAVSQKGLGSKMKTRTTVGTTVGAWQFAQAHQKVTPTKYITRMGKFTRWLSNNVVDLHIVDYNIFLENPTLVIDNIISKLNITVEDTLRQAAIDNVGLGKPGSETDSSKVWKRESGTLAISIYDALKSNVIEQPLIKKINKWLKNQKDQFSVQWVTEEMGLFLPVSPYLYMSMQSNPELVKNLVDKSVNREIFDCRKCRYYSRTGSIETIENKAVTFTRKKVRCLLNEKEVILEECFRCWKTERKNQPKK